MKKNTRIVAVLVFIVVSLLGIYLLAAGLQNTWDFLSLIKSPIFWGLFHIMTGIYLMRFIYKK